MLSNVFRMKEQSFRYILEIPYLAIGIRRLLKNRIHAYLNRRTKWVSNYSILLIKKTGKNI